jgi:hypothetical protein
MSEHEHGQDEGAAFAASQDDAAAAEAAADQAAAFDDADDMIEDEGPSAEDVVAALISALVSGNAQASENAIALAASAGYDVSGGGFIPQPKRDLVALAQPAEEEDAAEEADES